MAIKEQKYKAPFLQWISPLKSFGWNKLNSWVRASGKVSKRTLPDDGVTLVLYGDAPLISQTTLEACEQAARLGSVGLVVAEFSDPAQLGRIVRDDQGAITAIVEFIDASDEQRKIQEINSGIIAAPTELMSQWLDRLQSITRNRNTI